MYIAGMLVRQEDGKKKFIPMLDLIAQRKKENNIIFTSNVDVLLMG